MNERKRLEHEKPDPRCAIRTRMWRYCVGSVNKNESMKIPSYSGFSEIKQKCEKRKNKSGFDRRKSGAFGKLRGWPSVNGTCPGWKYNRQGQNTSWLLNDVVFLLCETACLILSHATFLLWPLRILSQARLYILTYRPMINDKITQAQDNYKPQKSNWKPSPED